MGGWKRAAPPKPEGSSGTKGFVHPPAFGGQIARPVLSLSLPRLAGPSGRAVGAPEPGGGEPSRNPTR